MGNKFSTALTFAGLNVTLIRMAAGADYYALFRAESADGHSFFQSKYVRDPSRDTPGGRVEDAFEIWCCHVCRLMRLPVADEIYNPEGAAADA